MPETENPNAAKTAATQPSVTFTLTNDPPFADDAIWKVYTDAEGGDESADVTASAESSTLTLTHASDIPAASYWVTVTEAAKSESGRLLLTVVTEYASGTSRTPTVSNSNMMKSAAKAASAGFTLTNSPAFAGGSAWKVYTEAKGGTPSTTVTASSSGTTLTLTHASDIPAASYWVTVTEAAMSESGRLELTITEYADLTSVAAIASYLSSASGGTTAAPVPLALSLNLTDAQNGWIGLLATINNAGKYVALYLSACTMGSTEFDLGTYNAGKNRIVSLVLPNAAQSVKAGTSSAQAFRDFTSLKSVEGANITSIGEGAFNDCSALTTVSLPAAASIGDQAFNDCDALTTASLPAATSIGDQAFNDCNALTTVSLPVATSIGASAFANCNALTTVSLPVATSIGASAFTYCNALATVSLPVATSIGASAFANCDALTTVSLPAATSIGDQAFNDCNALTTVSLPAAISIGDFAFAYCGTLFMVNLKAATSIGRGAFSGTALTTVSLPAVTSIDADAFSGCDALATVYLPAATDIGDSAFSGCNALTTVSLPAVTSIGDSAFYDCDALATVSLPATLTSIGARAFAGCAALSAFTVDSGNQNYKASADGKMLFSKDGTTLIAYPLAAGDVTLDSPITSIEGYAFYECDALTTVSLPAATSIGASAFYECDALATVSLPAATGIGRYAFYNCDALTTVSLPVATSIGASAFYGCDALATVSLPAATGIDDQAFYNCDALHTLTLPSDPPTLYSNVFGRNNYYNSYGTLTIWVPAGKVSAYTAAVVYNGYRPGSSGGGWGVSATTAANGNTSAYGYNHKRIVITNQ
jgi:hypothetical protein